MKVKDIVVTSAMLFSTSLLTLELTKNLNMKVTTHTNLKHLGVKYSRTECDFKATQLSDLKKHTDSRHLGVKYPCTECDYKATRQVNLQTHFNSKHAGVRYPCDQCDYKATTQVRILAFKTRRDFDIHL